MQYVIDAPNLTHVDHRCCWFHQIKAVGDHLGEGLTKKYQEDVKFNDYIQQFTVLALIDPQYIDQAFSHLKRRRDEFTGNGFEGLDKFVDYFEKVRLGRL